MLYEFNGKIYVKPFVNKIVEVEITKQDDVFDVKPTTKEVELTTEIRQNLTEISIEEAAKKASKSKKSLSEI